MEGPPSHEFWTLFDTSHLKCELESRQSGTSAELLLRSGDHGCALAPAHTASPYLPVPAVSPLTNCLRAST